MAAACLYLRVPSWPTVADHVRRTERRVSEVRDDIAVMVKAR